MPNKKIFLLAGPTASGKSALALAWAQANDGVIVNADSMQIYQALEILTARPSKLEQAGVPHFLYGHIDAMQDYSVGRWYGEVQELLTGPLLSAKAICFVGGTGLYFKALLGGLSPIPAPDPLIRDKWRQALVQEGPKALYQQLRNLDIVMAQSLNERDGQRIVRALEVYESSGKSLSYWHSHKKPNLISGYEVDKLLLLPQTTKLNFNIELRVEQMFQMGLESEVRNLLAKNIPSGAGILKVIGLQEVKAFIAGELDKCAAIDGISLQTKRYAKRQRTWFRHQLDSSWRIQDSVDL